jgi:hypothetical protein
MRLVKIGDQDLGGLFRSGPSMVMIVLPSVSSPLTVPSSGCQSGQPWMSVSNCQTRLFGAETSMDSVEVNVSSDIAKAMVARVAATGPLNPGDDSSVQGRRGP